MNTSDKIRETGFLRLKFSTEASEGLIEGYGSVSGNIDRGGDMVMPGAFAASLAEHASSGRMPVMLWMHDAAKPIGSWVEMREDDVGLRVRGRLNLKTEAGRDAYAHIVDGDVTGLSIGYQIPQGGSEKKNGVVLIKRATLFEISVVTLPMNERARIHLGSKADLEHLLTKSGVPKEAARRITFGGWPALNQAEPSETDQFAALVEAVKSSTLRFKDL